MTNKSNKHENYEILNMLGYGLAKFNNEFIKEFGFKTKKSFFEYFVLNGLVKTASVVKNRMDIFDPFFSSNNRKGWWQKKNIYIHRKILIDSLFGDLNVHQYSNVIKLSLKNDYGICGLDTTVKPIIKSRYKKMQETGLEAELYFMHTYEKIDFFKNGVLEDARLYGDGYDFQIGVGNEFYLIEVKGVKNSQSKIRLTEKEYMRAKEYKDNYILLVVLNLENIPNIIMIRNPIHKLKFVKDTRELKNVIEYHLDKPIEL